MFWSLLEIVLKPSLGVVGKKERIEMMECFQNA
jgi:hypothetical protein